MNFQNYEDRSNLRIKFASIDQLGFLQRDASEEYTSFFSETPSGWFVLEAPPVTTLRGDGRRTWFLQTRSEKVLAVEHETGIEFLVAVGASVASTAIVELISWAWKRWRESRLQGIQSGAKAEPTLVLETVEDRLPDGRVQRSRKLELRGPIDQAVLVTAMNQWRAA